jgi:sn-glycerol 3-phosphate transport system permease protein
MRVDGRRRPRLRRAGRYALLTLLALVVLFPLYVAVVSSLLSPDQLAKQPPTLFPSHPRWSAYSDAWSGAHLGTYLWNSAVVTAVITLGQVVTAVLAAYAFAFLEFPLKRTLFLSFLATLMVPFEVTVVTNVTTVRDLGWYNTYPALTVPFLATGFGAFLLRQAFLALPRDLRDSAALDGYGHWHFLTRVAVPLARPAIGALGVFAFLGAWNQYLWPLLVTRDDHLRTVQIGLRRLVTLHVHEPNVIFAGAVIAIVPVAIVLVLFQRHLVRGLTAGAATG